MEEQKLEILMQSKNLVETSYNVTAIQNRVYYYCLFSAQKERNGELSCSVRVEDLRKLIPNRNQCTLESLKMVFRVFKETSLLFEKQDNGDVIECDYNLISGYEYNMTKQEFKVYFSQRLYQHILSYTNYAPLNLEIMTRYTSFYSQRLYEALRMWSRTNQSVVHTFSIETLRFILGVGDKYPEYKNLKQRVLAQALKEINELGNMQVEMKEIKESKRVAKLEFTILDKEPKKYFGKNKKSDKEKIILGGMEEAIMNPEDYVCFPESDFFCTELKEYFIQWCYENSIFFDESTIVLFNEAKKSFIDKKKVKNISKMSDYKYFLGIFKNKMEDDIREFADMFSL